MMKSIPETAAWTGTITADAYSAAVKMDTATSLHVQVTHVGTLTGTVFIYGCNTEDGTYAALKDDADAAIEIGDLAGSDLVLTKTVHGIVSRFVKFFYDDTSGSGTLSANVVKVACE